MDPSSPYSGEFQWEDFAELRSIPLKSDPGIAGIVLWMLSLSWFSGVPLSSEIHRWCLQMMVDTFYLKLIFELFFEDLYGIPINLLIYF